MAVTKLTLSIDRQVAENGKEYARRSGRSLSSIVSEYLVSLRDAASPSSELSSDVASLMGIGSGVFDERDYRRHVENRQ